MKLFKEEGIIFIDGSNSLTLIKNDIAIEIVDNGIADKIVIQNFNFTGIKNITLKQKIKTLIRVVKFIFN